MKAHLARLCLALWRGHCIVHLIGLVLPHCCLAQTGGSAQDEGSAASHLRIAGQIEVGATNASGAPGNIATTGFGRDFDLLGQQKLGRNAQVFFDLEHRFDITTGKGGAMFRAEKAVPGIDTGIGRLQLGRFKNALGETVFKGDPFGDNTLASQIANGPTPYAFNLQYHSGPWNLALAHAKNAGNGGRTVALAGNYKLAAITLFTAVGHSSQSERASASKLQLGGAMALGNEGTLKLVLGTYQDRANLAGREHKIGLGYWRQVNQYTLLYVDMRHSRRVVGNQQQLDIGILLKYF